MSETIPVYYGIRDAAKFMERSTSVAVSWYRNGRLVPDAYTSTGYPLFKAATLEEENARHLRGTGNAPDDIKQSRGHKGGSKTRDTYGTDFYRRMAQKSAEVRRANKAARALPAQGEAA